MDGASFHAQDPTLFSYGNNGIAWETSKANEKKKKTTRGKGVEKYIEGKNESHPPKKTSTAAYTPTTFSSL